MKLKVIEQAEPWFNDGLKFTCTECGNCCTGGPGYIWLSEEELHRLADHLKLPVEQVVRKYCRTIGGKLSLKERINAGNYDCIFLRHDPDENGQVRRRCGIYQVRPLQCRTWPFWDGLLTSRDSWDRASHRCPGMNSGKHYTRKQIESLRDATDWPNGEAKSDSKE
jgi:uncharacterized protein